MDITLHVGTQKTGSKAIQYFLMHELATAAGGAMCFPQSGREGGWHQPIYFELLRGETRLLSAAVREIVSSGTGRGVLSCELFYSLPSEAIRLMQDIVKDARIILFMRRQDQLVNALYNQFIKSHRVGIGRIRQFESSIGDYIGDFDHWKTIARWEAVFGRHRVVPVVYSKHEDAAEVFADLAGIPWPGRKAGPEGVNPNPALGISGARILRRVKELCEHDADLPILVTVAHRVLGHLFVDTHRHGDLYLISARVRHEIFSRYRESNAVVQASYFPGRERLFPPVTTDDVKAADGVAEPLQAMQPLDGTETDLVGAIFRAANLRPRGA